MDGRRGVVDWSSFIQNDDGAVWTVIVRSYECDTTLNNDSASPCYGGLDQ